MSNEYQEHCLNKLKEEQKKDVEQIALWKSQVSNFDKTVRERAQVIALLEQRVS